MEPLSASDPRTVGEFQLHALLGSGGMGRVYLGFSRAGRAVAVKVVHPELARDQQFTRRFRQEVAAARVVSGLYTAPVVTAGLDDDPPWLATVFVPGPSLATLISSHGPLPEAAGWRLAAGLVEALQAVHSCGLIHRDLKPANVLLAADGPHVIDFGISRTFDGTTLTAKGMVVGTPGFMSPEQASGAEVGQASDVFSLGCVLAYAAAGVQPFGEGSAPAVLYRVVSGQPNLAAVPPGLRGIAGACLDKNPAGRPGLADLAAVISRDAPAVAASPTSFWPGSLAEVIRRYQAESGSDASFAVATHAATARQPTAWEAGNPAAPQPVAQAAYQAAARVPAAGQQHYPGGPPSTRIPAAGEQYSPAGPPWMPQSPAMPSNQPPVAGAWPPAPAAPSQPAPGWSMPPRPRIPGSVLTAVRLMYAGAAVSLVNVVVSLAAINQIKTAFEAQHPLADNAAQGVAALAAAAVIISGVVAIGVWLTLASASRRGRSWPRTAGTILFALDTLFLLGTLGRAGIPATKTFGVLTWLIGLIAVICLWRRESGDYFDAWRRRR
jgi:tRNA A-37 threonylcarbamoyl transferase component Bud32